MAISRASQAALVVKNPSANAGDIRDVGSVPRSGRSAGEGYGSALQYSCLENPTDRGAWWAAVHGVASSGHDLATEHIARPCADCMLPSLQVFLRIWQNKDLWGNLLLPP